MITELWLWLILVLPLSSSVVIALILRPLGVRYSKYSGHVTVLTVGGSFVLSLWALQSLVLDQDLGGTWGSFTWLKVGMVEVSFGVTLEPLTSIMLVLLTGISLLVQIYSIGYMHGDPGYPRYFGLMSLFTASMVGLVIASSIVQLYFFWELVGLCSYLLIGFWYNKPAAAAAAKKAFIVTRIGDFGFLLAIMYLVLNAGIFESQGLNPLEISSINANLITSSVAGWVAIGILAGAIGKSGQFPLHTWLPDAMEGPTPVSALIHSATMVAAGVFLVARFFPLFEQSTMAMNSVALIGGFTAIFAASMGLVMNDIKRVLAYSTISQLGYMMLALGIGAYSSAIFHLVTHSFFKALLFLGAGSVSHTTGTFDMRFMGGLRRVMPVTYLTFLIGTLSLSGIFPLSGFWSKDEILAHALNGSSVISEIVFWLAMISVFLTSFYMFRVLIMTFWGKFKGGINADTKLQAQPKSLHLGESPMNMILPMVVLAIAALVLGPVVNSPFDLGFIQAHWLNNMLHSGDGNFNLNVAIASSVLSVTGIFAAYIKYHSSWKFSARFNEYIKPGQKLLLRRYYLDDAYEDILTVKVFYGGIAKSLDWIDKSVVDKIVQEIEKVGRNIGSVIARIQTGQLQNYGMVISLSIVIILGLYMFIL